MPHSHRNAAMERVLGGARVGVSLFGVALAVGVAILGARAASPWPADAPALRAAVTVACLLAAAVVLGRVAWQEKRSRREAAAIAAIMAKVQAAPGLTPLLQGLFQDVAHRLGARHLVLVARALPTGKAYLWEVPGSTETPLDRVQPRELESSAQALYFFESPGQAWYVTRRPDGGAVPDALAEHHPFRTLLAVSFRIENECSGRLFVLDPRADSPPERHLRFLQRVVREAVPAVQAACRLRRIEARAGAAERARVARELHDGPIQSLIAIEMELEALRRQAGQTPRTAKALSSIQGRLRQEVVGLRELTSEMRPAEFNREQLLGVLAERVDRFRRETGIAATFASDLREVSLPEGTCHEVARIVQEGLVNVRKHSRARNVRVHFGQEDGSWKVVIADDGRGFGFSGRLEQAALDANGEGPLVIKERVRSIGGALAVESHPRRGARLEITVPKSNAS